MGKVRGHVLNSQFEVYLALFMNDQNRFTHMNLTGMIYSELYFIHST